MVEFLLMGARIQTFRAAYVGGVHVIAYHAELEAGQGHRLLTRFVVMEFSTVCRNRSRHRRFAAVRSPRGDACGGTLGVLPYRSFCAGCAIACLPVSRPDCGSLSPSALQLQAERYRSALKHRRERRSLIFLRYGRGRVLNPSPILSCHPPSPSQTPA